MVKFLTLGSLLLTVANWAVALASKFLHRGSRAERYVGPASSLKQSGSMLFRYSTDQDPCIAVRTPEGRLVAYSQVCTHLSCAVIYDKAENGLFCPCHHGLFNLEGQPIAGPPTRPLPRVQLGARACSGARLNRLLYSRDWVLLDTEIAWREIVRSLDYDE